MRITPIKAQPYRGKRLRSSPRRKAIGGLSVAFVLCLMVFITSTILFVSTYYSAEKEKESFVKLAGLVEASEVQYESRMEEGELPNSSEETLQDQAESPSDDSRLAPLYELNSDFIGWLAIEGTTIDYPVMYTPEDPEYYLRRDFEKNVSNSGVPFIGEGCGLNSNSIIIYGHNMKNGTMFSDLLKYSEKSFWESHPVITFETLQESAEYEIVSAFRERVHYQDEMDGFRFYAYGGTLTNKQFDDYIGHLTENSLYDTGTEVSYGDQLLTLATCSYHVENGRFVVVAKRQLSEK